MGGISEVKLVIGSSHDANFKCVCPSANWEWNFLKLVYFDSELWCLTLPGQDTHSFGLPSYCQSGGVACKPRELGPTLSSGYAAPKHVVTRCIVMASTLTSTCLTRAALAACGDSAMATAVVVEQ